eukprot:scaffold397495_cov33-Attheya_sp.AAC.1
MWRKDTRTLLRPVYTHASNGFKRDTFYHYTKKQWPSSAGHHWRNVSEQTTQQQKQPRQLKAWQMRAI